MNSRFSRTMRLITAALLGGFIFPLQAQTTITVGTGTAAASTNALLSTSTTTNLYSRTATVYSAADILAAGGFAGTITKIRYYKDGTGEYPNPDAFLHVLFKPYPTPKIINYPINWAVESATATTVYTSNTQNFQTGPGWQELTLSTPWLWNGTDNILVMVDWYRPSTPTAAITWRYTSVDSTNATQVSGSLPATMANGKNSRPNIQFDIIGNISNDAAVISIDSVFNQCAGNLVSVYARIINSGNNPIDSVLVNWELNGALQAPVWHNTTMLTGQAASVFLGTFTLAASTMYDITSWTSLPNNTLDGNTQNDTFQINSLQASLSGHYTLGGIGADYPSFNSAVNALINYGVCSPVTFNIASGIYNEQISLQDIAGASSTNTIEFKSISGDSTLVTLQYNGTATSDNYVIALGTAKHFTFRGMTLSNPGTTFCTVIFASGGADFNTFSNCLIKGDPNTTSTTVNKAVVYSTTGLDNYNTFSNNLIWGGSYGVYWDGVGTASLEAGNVFKNNRFLNQYTRASQIYYQDSPEFIGNSLSTNTSLATPYGFTFYYCDNALKVVGNIVEGTHNGYGMYFSNCDATATTRGLIANNFVRRGNTASTATVYGIYFTGNTYQDFVFNNVLIESNATASRALYSTTGGNNRAFNNIFVNTGAGYGVYLNSATTFVQSDYNNIYVPNGNTGYQGSAQATLAAWKNQTGFDLNSHAIDPGFKGGNDLHICSEPLYRSGLAYNAVTHDIDGDARPSVPTIGADEFSLASDFSLGNDTSVCENIPFYLGSGATDLQYIWNTTQTTPTILVPNQGVYWVNVSNECSTGGDTITITFIPETHASFTHTTSAFNANFTNTSVGSGNVWFWDFGDGNTSTSLNPTHTYTTSGWHTVSLIAEGDCSTDTFVTDVLISITGITENESQFRSRIYPNPAADLLTVEVVSTYETPAMLTIRSIEGKVLQNVSLSTENGSKTNMINIGDLPSGVYTVEIRSAGTSTVHKVIKL